MPGGFGPGLGSSWAEKKQGRWCRTLWPSVPRICGQIRSRVSLPVRPGGAGMNQSMKDGLMSRRTMGVCVHHMYFSSYMCQPPFLLWVGCMQRQCVKWHTHNSDPDKQA